MNVKLQPDRVAAMVRLANAWLTRGSLWMRRAEREIPAHTPYSSQMVRACLECNFQGCNENSLREWLKHDLPCFSRPVTGAQSSVLSPQSSEHPRACDAEAAVLTSRRRILILSPSTVFAATWQAVTAVWLAGCRPVIKPSQREPSFVQLLQASARQVAGDVLPIDILKPTLRLNSQSSVLSPQHSELKTQDSFAAIIAYGTEMTLHALGSHPGIRRRLIAFGPRVSVALIGKHTPRGKLDEVIENAGLDAVLYETQGCLSPQCFFVEDGAAISAERFAEALSQAMRRLDSTLPQVPVSDEVMETESFWQRWKFRASQGNARIFGRNVILHSEPNFEPCGLRRAVLVAPLRGASNLPKRCGKWAPYLSSIATSDDFSRSMLERIFDPKSGIRFCEIGRMHEPPPNWRNGGLNLLEEISKRGSRHLTKPYKVL